MNESSNHENPKLSEFTTVLHVDGRAYDVHVEVLRDGFQGYVIANGMYFLTLPWAASRRELLDTATRRIRDAR